MTLRILHVLDHSIPLQSGYAFRTRAILREQRRLGWETFQLTSPKHAAPYAAEEDVDGLHFYRTAGIGSIAGRIAGVRELALMHATRRRLDEVVRSVRPDVLHAHSPVLNAIPALAVGRSFGIPVVYEVRAFWEDAAADHGTSREWGLRYRSTRALETFALSRADAVTTICEGLRSEMITRGIPPAKVTVIPNAVDIEKFAGARAVDEALKAKLGLADSIVLGFIGSFYGYEGLSLLIDALARIRSVDPRVRVLLVGGGPQEAALKEHALASGLAESVVFTGRVPHHDVERYYDLVDVLVYPRLSMRLTDLVTPLKPLEAMAQGRLVVASDVGGHRELIADGVNGVLFKANDAEALAARVLALLNDRSGWGELRAAARRFVEGERNWAVSVARYRGVYQRLAGRAELAHGAPLALRAVPPRGSNSRLGRPGALMPQRDPRVVVFTTLFPHAGQPAAGLFIRERMFRVARSVPLTVVVPVPWFPFQGIVRRWKPGFRPVAPACETQDGIEVRFPRFFSVPGALKRLDGFFIAIGALPTMLRLRRSFAFNVIDAHFAYPDGYAATMLGRWLGVPVTVTLRGTEIPLSRDPPRRSRIVAALERAQRIFAVSDSLKRHAIELGIPRDKIVVVGNGVDCRVFTRVDRQSARDRLALPANAPLLVSVGALVERKGFHRVIECLPALRARFPDLRYLIVGGPGPEGDWSAVLRRHAAEAGVAHCVHFLGALPPAELKWPLSAADVFVLATRNEGWANVFLEAMACGLPVVATDVGGNREVVANDGLGTLVAFGDRESLTLALAGALERHWDRDAIVAHATANGWDARVAVLTDELAAIARGEPAADLGNRAVRCA